MGETVDFNIVSDEYIGIDILLKVISKILCINDINCSFMCIDDWSYKNERKIKNVNELNNCILNEKIIIVEVSDKECVCMGIFAEHTEKYCYDIWFNDEYFYGFKTDGFDQFDLLKYFEYCYYIIKELDAVFKDVFDIIAVGRETVFKYLSDVKSTIVNSHNIDIWIVRNTMSYVLQDYENKTINGLNYFVFEKIIKQM